MHRKQTPIGVANKYLWQSGVDRGVGLSPPSRPLTSPLPPPRLPPPFWSGARCVLEQTSIYIFVHDKTYICVANTYLWQNLHMRSKISIYYEASLCVANKHLLRIGECPSIAPFLENNGPRPRKGPRSIVFKEWNDTRTFAYVKSTHRLQPLPQYMLCINVLPYIINYCIHVSIHIFITYCLIYPSLFLFYISEISPTPLAPW